MTHLFGLSKTSSANEEFSTKQREDSLIRARSPFSFSFCFRLKFRVQNVGTPLRLNTEINTELLFALVWLCSFNSIRTLKTP